MNHPKQEQTLVIIKPDGIQRGLIGEVVRRYEQTGLKLSGLKMVVPTPEQVEKHYLVDPSWKEKVGKNALAAYKEKGLTPPTNNAEEAGARVLEALKKYLSAGPVVAMVWRGMHAVGVVRKITGSTEPMSSDVGTIRGDFTIDSYEVSDSDGRAVRNVVHASGDTEEAKKETALWFHDDELHNYRLVHEAILYDVNLDGILE